MTLSNSRHDSIKAYSRKKNRKAPSDEIVTKIDNIEDKVDCLQRHVTLSCASFTDFKDDVLISIRELVLRILKEEQTRRINSQ